MLYQELTSIAVRAVLQTSGHPVLLSAMPAWVADSAGLSWDLSGGAAVAAAVRAAARQQLGLTVSVGVAPNKLLAKLASRAAKPDGVLVVDSVGEVQRLLADTPVDRLPGERVQQILLSLGGAVMCCEMFDHVEQ